MNSKFIDRGQNTTVCMIPGGPGLGSSSFIPLAEALTGFNVLLIEAPTKAPENYKGLMDITKTEVNKVSGDKILLGHSFGGIVAGDIFIANQTEFMGLALVGTPISKTTFESVSSQGEKLMTEKAKQAGQTFSDNPTGENLNQWMVECGELYFTKENLDAGAKMLLSDMASGETFVKLRSAASGREELIEILKEVNKQKIVISGKEDSIVLPERQQAQAELMGANFYAVDGGHFCHFENSNEVASLLSKTFSKGGTR